MTWTHKLRRRVRALFSKSDIDGEMNEEMRLHLALETEELMRTGLPREEAARRAHVAFGGVERHKQEARDARGVHSIEDRIRDFAYIVRSLRRAPAFTLAVVFSLALGIGANSTMFTIISAVMLRPLPYAHQDELVGVLTMRNGAPDDQVPEPFFRGWDHATRTLPTIAFYNTTAAAIAGDRGGAPERTTGASTTARLFSILGVAPASGRQFAPVDEDSAAAPVVILGDALWRTRFAADTTILGRTIYLDEKPRTVVGVMPRGFDFPEHAAYWIPWKVTNLHGGYFYGRIVGRMRAGAGIADVQRELAALPPKSVASPGVTPAEHIVVESLHDQLYGSAKPALRVLFAAVLLLLLIACANVANLTFARTLRRQREFAVRVTLGATRRTVAWLILAESAALAAAGAAAGLMVSVWTTRLFVRLSPASITRVSAISADSRVFAFTAGLATISALAAGIGPALGAARRDPRAGLSDGGTRAGTGRLATRIRCLLVAAQLSAAVALLAGAGLLTRSLQKLSSVDLGFRPDHVLTVNVPLPGTRYPDGAHTRAFFDALELRVRGVRGVSEITYGAPPLSGFTGTTVFGRTSPYSGKTLSETTVGPRFFETYGVPVLQGRGIASTDDSSSAPVAVLNATAARAFFPDGNAIGRQFDGYSVDGNRHPTIVGIVADFPQRDIAARAGAELFASGAQGNGYLSTIAIRTSANPESFVSFVRSAVHDIDPAIALGSVKTMDNVVAASLAPTRFASLLLGAFALLALTLATLGLYGVISYGVAQRAREFGIRAALGADGRTLMWLVTGEMLWVVGLGLSTGLAAAWSLSRLLHTLLYATGVHDPVTFVVVPVTLLLTTAIATLLPARKAMRVNLLDVIQAE